MAQAQKVETRELWLLEILRRAREVVHVNTLLPQLDALPPEECNWRDAAFQQRLVDVVLHDAQQKAFPPNRFENAYFFKTLLQSLQAGLKEGEALHSELAAKLEDALRVDSSHESEDLTAGWYRNYEVAAQAEAEAEAEDKGDGGSSSSHNNRLATTCTSGPTGSVLVLPHAPSRRVYPFRVETGNMAASIGLVMWPAGFLMAEFALDNPDLFRGKRVLELGAGIGLTSVFVARGTQPAAMIATDFDVRALKNIQHNFKINGLCPADSKFVSPEEDPSAVYTSSDLVALPSLCSASPASSAVATDSSSASPSASVARCEMATARVDWYNYSPAQLAAFNADVIIACDTTYVEAILVPFAQSVHACLQANPAAVVYLAQAQRHPSTFLLYLDALRDEGLKLREMDTDKLRQRFNYDRDTCPVALHQVTL